MLSCQEISKLVSESLDRQLSPFQRMGLYLHLMMCNMCRAYRRQMLSLRDILSLHAASQVPAELSEAAKERIKRTLASQ